MWKVTKSSLQQGTSDALEILASLPWVGPTDRAACRRTTPIPPTAPSPEGSAVEHGPSAGAPPFGTAIRVLDRSAEDVLDRALEPRARRARLQKSLSFEVNPLCSIAEGSGRKRARLDSAGPQLALLVKAAGLRPGHNPDHTPRECPLLRFEFVFREIDIRDAPSLPVDRGEQIKSTRSSQSCLVSFLGRAAGYASGRRGLPPEWVNYPEYLIPANCFPTSTTRLMGPSLGL